MEGGYNQYPKQTKNNSALRIHLANKKANAGAAVQDVVVPPTANVNASNDVVEQHGKQPLDPSQPKSCALREQDMYMPIANVIRIMRRILPSHAKISDDAKETVQECVSEFISFITGEANQHCRDEERKTITAEDIIWAMKQLDFNDYINPITTFMNRYRESQYGRPLAQKEPNSRRYGGGDGGEVVDCEPLRMDGTGPLAMGGAGPIGSIGPIGPAMYKLGPQQPFYDPSMMNPYNFRYNSSDSAGASSSLGYPPGFNPYAHYK